jgi:hypothetical protein
MLETAAAFELPAVAQQHLIGQAVGILQQTTAMHAQTLAMTGQPSFLERLHRAGAIASKYQAARAERGCYIHAMAQPA